MSKATFLINNFEFSFTDEDVCNPDDWIPAGEYNPHNVRPWLLHDHGTTLAVVFADCEQDAIDEAVDHGRLKRYSLDEDELKDYNDEEGISFLGNHGEAHDIESLGILQLPNPRASFAVQFAADDKGGK
jgi:hypothetical protein